MNSYVRLLEIRYLETSALGEIKTVRLLESAKERVAGLQPVCLQTR